MMKEYELYRWDREDLSGHITVYVESNKLMIEDYSAGSTCESFFGEDEHELKISVDAERAGIILAHLGLDVSEKPTEALGSWLAAEMTGCSKAASKFRKLAKKAGVKVDVFVW